MVLDKRRLAKTSAPNRANKQNTRPVRGGTKMVERERELIKEMVKCEFLGWQGYCRKYYRLADPYLCERCRKGLGDKK